MDHLYLSPAGLLWSPHRHRPLQAHASASQHSSLALPVCTNSIIIQRVKCDTFPKAVFDMLGVGCIF
jgi:hypothetical protein